MTSEQAYRAGVLATRKGDHASAVDSFSTAYALEPADPDLLWRLGASLLQTGDAQAAHDAVCRALAYDPGNPAALTVLGCILSANGDAEDALAAYNDAERRAPGAPTLRWNRSHVNLMMRQWAKGWEDYQWGFAARVRKARIPAHVQVRRGDCLAGKSVVVFSEQGAGDHILFCRYARWLKERHGAASVTLEVPAELLAVMYSQDLGVDLILATREDGSFNFDYDAALHLMDLPWFLGLEPGDAEAVLPLWDWPERRDLGARIGLSWCGNPDHQNDKHRSLSAEDAKRLDCGLPMVSLCPGRELPFDMVAPEVSDWSHTAAVLGPLDAVVAVDTGVAHLAGAMGKRVFLLLSRNADFRWTIQSGQPTYWYPRLSIYAQERLGDWGPVLEQVVRDLRAEFGDTP